jgi:probable HAF family extracellular repeat protein
VKAIVFYLRLVITAATVGFGTAKAQFVYTAIDLGTLGSGYSEAVDVNNVGQVVGRSLVGSVGHSFVYTSGHLVDITAGVFAMTDSKATGINALGQVVGEVHAAVGPAQYGYLYSGGYLSQIPGLSTASGINDSGDIIGQYTSTYVQQATVFHTQGSLTGTRTDLGVIEGGPISWATDINNSGMVVGGSMTTSGYTWAATGQATSSNSLTKRLDLGPGAAITGVNDFGQMVGSANGAPFIMSGSTVTNLGSLGTGLSFSDINDSGLLVGSQIPAVNTKYAVVYSGGKVSNLNAITNLSGTAFATLEEATAISDTGYIVGNGRTAGGTMHAFLLTPTLALTPVPEPATYGVIAALTLTGMATYRCRRRCKRS